MNIPESYSFDKSQKVLGRGRFAKVILVTNKVDGKQLAAKIARTRCSGRDVTNQLLQEISILKSASHIPSIVNFHEAIVKPLEITLFIEYCSGGDLYHHISRSDHPLSEEEAIEVMKQLLQALNYLHAQLIVHLDIKPDNILLKHPYPCLDIALCDFGLAKQLDVSQNVCDLVGTPDYTAPEILNYEPVDLPADMWSVGCTCYYLISGVSPFNASTKELTMVRVSKVEFTFEDGETESEHFSDMAKEFMSALLLRKPQERLTVSKAVNHSWIQSHSSDRILTSVEARPSLSIQPSMELDFASTDEQLIEKANDDLRFYENIETSDCPNLPGTQSSRVKKLMDGVFFLLDGFQQNLNSLYSCQPTFSTDSMSSNVKSTPV